MTTDLTPPSSSHLTSSSSTTHSRQHSSRALLTHLDDFANDNADADTDTDPLSQSPHDAASSSTIYHSRHNYYSRPLSIGHYTWGGNQQDPHISSDTAPRLPECVASPGKTSQQSEPIFWTGYTKSQTASQRISNMTAAVAEETPESGNVANAVRTSVPGSPPELSYSKSSKSDSSSYRSSLSEDGGVAEKLSHLEDITLDGRDSPESIEEAVSVNSDSNLKPESRPTLKRPPPPRAQTAAVQMRDNSAIREAANGGRRGYPIRSLSNGGAREQHILGLPKGARGATGSPSSPSFPLNAPHRSPSRSPSPKKQYVQSPTSMGSATPRASHEGQAPHPYALTRSSSWQPGRKTVKELEAECDDLDDEVPEEAVLENVPVTPMPGMPPQSSRPSQSRSNTPSPHNRPPYPSGPSQPLHNNLHSAKVPKHARRPHAPTNRINTSFGGSRSPKSRRPGMMPHSATTGGFQQDQLGATHRSKSWAQHLNDEAREVSAALEEYHERRSGEKRDSGGSSVPSSPPRPSRSSSSLMDLPPKQKGNVMIDPLPISKEKEAVLTRTRPSWLPPKSQKEEKKHMRQWEKMMAKAVAAEKKREVKEQEDTESRAELQDSSARIWEHHVLPQWDAVVHEPRTRELWWRGVPPESRGLVWQRAIGNELSLTEASYTAALKRANDLEARISSLDPEERKTSKEAAWFSAITRDVATTLPPITTTTTTTSPENFHTSLANVLKAYTLYRSDVGYVHGTHLIAATLHSNLDPANPSLTFQTLANLLNRPIPQAFLIHDTAAMTRVYDLVLNTLEYKFPTLHAHLTNQGLQPSEYLDPMFRCLFARNLHPGVVSRLWDVMVFEGDKALIRAAVAVLGCLEGRLYGGGGEGVRDLVSWRFEGVWEVGSGDDFVGAVRGAGKVEKNTSSAGEL